MNKVESQVERFKKGFPWLDIVAAATPARGIRVLTEAEADAAVAYEPAFPVRGRCKFVPASGAASRMFKDIFAGLDTLKNGEDVEPGSALARLAASIDKFAFWSEKLFGPEIVDSPEYRRLVAEKVLTDAGLGYGAKPKGVIKFHRYPDGETRTAFAEHLVEGQAYMRGEDGVVNLTVTISPEHKPLFEAVLAEVKQAYEARFGVRYNVRFTFQDPETDTVAVDMDNKPFLKEDGSMLFRPAGHGALIHNLDAVREELISIKNIDNVSNDRFLPLTARWKKVLAGKALELRDKLYMYLTELDMQTMEGIRGFEPFLIVPAHNGLQEDRFGTPEVQALCQEIEEFLSKELCIEMPLAHDCRARVEALREKLNRPVRVCGMVRNEGQPGGGPFLIREADGSTSLQILESVQINSDDPQAVATLQGATHFNPVDIICCVYDYQGEKFHLTDFVDEETGFISRKSYQGRELKALELPGLWNGAMSGWNTLFVEVPAETFSPVKVVLDLLKAPHQGA